MATPPDSTASSEPAAASSERAAASSDPAAASSDPAGASSDPAGGSSDPAPPTSPPLRWPAFLTVTAMATWPYLTLVGDNLDQPLDLGAVRTWWLVTLVGALVVVGLAMLVDRRIGRWLGTVVGVVLWTLFSLPTIVGLRGEGSTMGDVAWWWLVTAAIVVVATVAARYRPVQVFATIMAVGLAVSAAVPVAVAVVGGWPDDDTPVAQPVVTDPTFTTTPNVWFIALDGLAANDFMLERTGYDGSWFEDDLEDRGFAVQRGATSNYPFTNLSISSSLMMDYGFEGVDEPPAGPFFERLQGANATVELMRANGYSYAHTYPGLWTGSKCVGLEDLCIGDQGSVTDTETAMAAMTPLGDWLTTRSRHEDVAIANDPSHVVGQVLAAHLPDPSFNFVHVLNPHAPLLRDADCDIREVEFTFSAWGDGPEYAGAVECLHHQLADAVDLIVADDPDAVIVVQSDHGPRLGIDWTQPGGVFLDDDMYFSIFSAIRLPDDCDVAVPDDLTPVNTFRIVRACLEDTDADLLPNRRFPIQAERG